MKKEINKSNIDGYKVAMAVRQLESSIIHTECYDIKDGNISEILMEYGIFYKWNDEEKTIIKDILTEMAAYEEIKEAERWAKMEHDPILTRVPNRPIPSLLILDIQQKIWKAEIKKQRELEEPDPSDWAEDILKEQKLGVM
jgi:hypothetical protein